MIKVQNWNMKHSNIIVSPITNDTLLVKDEITDTYLCLFIFISLLYY